VLCFKSEIKTSTASTGVDVMQVIRANRVDEFCEARSAILGPLELRLVITEPVEGSLPYRSMRSQPFERLAE